MAARKEALLQAMVLNTNVKARIAANPKKVERVSYVPDRQFQSLARAEAYNRLLASNKLNELQSRNKMTLKGQVSSKDLPVHMSGYVPNGFIAEAPAPLPEHHPFCHRPIF